MQQEVSSVPPAPGLRLACRPRAGALGPVVAYATLASAWWDAAVGGQRAFASYHRRVPTTGLKEPALRHQIRHSRRMTSNEPSAETGSGQQRFPSFPVVSNDDGLTTRCRWHLQSERIGRTRQAFLYFSWPSDGTVLTLGLGLRGRACRGWDVSVAAAARRSSKSGAT